VSPANPRYPIKRISKTQFEYRDRKILRYVTPHGDVRYSVAREGDRPGGVDESLRGLLQWIDKYRLITIARK
jgi:hypothetical protein